jgi:hypothetical protein
MKARFYSMLALALATTVVVANIDINLWMAPFICFGIYTLFLKCPKCGRWTLALGHGSCHIAWIPRKCEQCGHVYN